MSKRIHVGNLPLKVERSDVKAAFDKVGAVESINMKTSDDGKTAEAIIAFANELDRRTTEALDRLLDKYEFPVVSGAGGQVIWLEIPDL